MLIFEPSSKEERRRYYREEWNVQDLPEFLKKDLIKREFGFDHIGRGPNHRHKVFKDLNDLRRFMKSRFPFAAYCSVAFYNKPKEREDWLKSELVFDVDAKDLPTRSCKCENICEICLEEARQLICQIVDTLKGDLGLNSIHIIYSGRGYHIRILDPRVMNLDNDVRAQILKYVVGGEVPKIEYKDPDRVEDKPYKMDHFTIPFGYPSVFTQRMKYVILHLSGNEKIEGVTPQTLKKIVDNRVLIEENNWPEFRQKFGPVVYRNLVEGISKLNMGLVDAKVSIDLKRILRMPTSLHSKVSMRCMEVKNIETFDPLKEAVPKFVLERRGN